MKTRPKTKICLWDDMVISENLLKWRDQNCKFVSVHLAYDYERPESDSSFVRTNKDLDADTWKQLIETYKYDFNSEITIYN